MEFGPPQSKAIIREHAPYMIVLHTNVITAAVDHRSVLEGVDYGRSSGYFDSRCAAELKSDHEGSVHYAQKIHDIPLIS